MPNRNPDPKVTFLNSVFLFAGIVAFAMGFYRWQQSVVMGVIDFAFALCCFALVYHLNRHKERVDAVSSVALLLCYGLFTAIYLLAPYNTTRISLFFLLSASAFFLKGRQAGLNWLLLILLTLVIGHSAFDTAYSHFDILTACLYLMALFFIFFNYEKFKEKLADREREKELLRLSEERFRTLIENGHDLIGIISATGNVSFISPSVVAVLGFTPDELVGKNVKELIDPGELAKAAQALDYALAHPGGDSLEKYEFRMKHKDGGYRDIEMIGRNLLDNPVIGGIVLNGRDITQFKQHAQQLEHLAHYDHLTGIANRVLLKDRLKQAIARTTRERDMLAICCLDLDGFKQVNDTMGHEAGDLVLVEIARRIQNTIRGDDTVARQGGDEFVILLLGLERRDECSSTLDRLLAAIAAPMLISGQSVGLSASIGVSTYPLDSADPNILLEHADQSMYTAKQSGKNRYHFYDLALVPHD